MAIDLAAVWLLLCLFPGVMSCPQIQKCMNVLESFFNLTNVDTDFSALIPHCLNIVSKEGTLRACELDAQMACKFAGFEPEYRNFKIKKNEANDECLRDCPNMIQVKICHGYIDYDIIQESGYSAFCRHFQNISATCVDKELSTCSFRDQLFESGFSSDGKQIIRNICNSGCSNVDGTIKSIQSCNKQLSIAAQDSRFTECGFYQKYKSCIQNQSPCSQFLKVAQYFTNISTAMSKCEPFTTSPAASTTPTTIKETISTTSRKITTSPMASTFKTTEQTMKTGTVSNSKEHTTSVFDKTVMTKPFQVTQSTTSASVKKENLGFNVSDSDLTYILTTSGDSTFDNFSKQNTPSPVIARTTYSPKKVSLNSVVTALTMTTMAALHSDKQTSSGFSKSVVTNSPPVTQFITTSASVKKRILSLNDLESNITNILTTSDDKLSRQTPSVPSFVPASVMRTTNSPSKGAQYNVGSLMMVPSGIVLFYVGVVSWCLR